MGAVFVVVERLTLPSRSARPDTAPSMSALRSKSVAQKTKSRGEVLAAGGFQESALGSRRANRSYTSNLEPTTRTETIYPRFAAKARLSSKRRTAAPRGIRHTRQRPARCFASIRPLDRPYRGRLHGASLTYERFMCGAVFAGSSSAVRRRAAAGSGRPARTVVPRARSPLRAREWTRPMRSPPSR
jgi:hypothetical protein